MSIASHVTTWEEGRALGSRLQTNLSATDFFRWVARCGRAGAVESVEEHGDLLRLNGGPYLIVKWRVGVTREEVRAVCSARCECQDKYQQAAIADDRAMPDSRSRDEIPSGHLPIPTTN